MLPNNAIHAAIPLVQALNRKGLNIVPVENSPLAALVKATGGVEILPNQEQGEVDLLYISSEISVSTNNDSGPLPNQHNIITDELGPELGKAVRKHIAYAKNVVSPSIEHMVQETNTILSTFAPSALLGLEVTVFKLPKIFKNASLLGSFDSFKEAKFNPDFRLPFDLPAVSGEEIQKVIESEVSGLGKDLTDWFAEVGVGKVEEYFTTFFTSEISGHSSPSVGSFVNGVVGIGGGITADLNKLLFLHLVSKAFFSKVPPGMNVNLATYEFELAQLRDMTGARLNDEFISYDRAIESDDALIMSMDGKRICVFEENYKKFLESGGENETIFGVVVSNSRAFRTSQILEKKAEFDALWNKHVGLIQITESNKRFVRIKEALEAVFEKMLDEDKEEDATVNKEVALKLFREQLGEIVVKDTECLYSLCTRLLCRSRYAHTDAEMILDGINRVMKENPKLDVREAAAISMIDYTAYWVFSLFRVV